MTVKYHIRNALGEEDYMLKMGYDGVVVGTGDEMVIVKFQKDKAKPELY